MRPNRTHPSKPFYRVVLPLTANELSHDDDVRDLVRSFARIDPKVAEALQNRSVTRVKLRIHQDQDRDTQTNTQADADFLYEDVFSRCADLLTTSRLSFDQWKALLFAYCDKSYKIPPQERVACTKDAT